MSPETHRYVAPTRLRRSRSGLLALTEFAAIAGACAAASCTAAVLSFDDPIDLTVVPTEADPLDLPGRGPAPKTRSDVNLPPPVQSGARPKVPPDPREWWGADGKPWTEWSRLTGDWSGSRTDMEQAGITVAGSVRVDWTSVLSGGLSRGGYSRRLIDVNLTLDLDPLSGGNWQGGSVYADFYHYGGETGEPSGSAQGTDVISSPHSMDQLAECWFQQSFFDGMLRIKGGKIDANAEFAVLPCATGFISACGSWDPALLDMPTYPDPAMGLVGFVTPNDSFFVGAGVFDGATHDGYPTGSRGPATFFSDSKSDSWYIIAEAGLSWEQIGELGNGRVSLGGWYHTGEYERFDTTTQDGAGGFYFTAQQQVCNRSDTPGDPEAGVFVFARAAFADGDVALIQSHFSAGAVAKGTFTGRDADEAGVMLSVADFASGSGSQGCESIIEVYYAIAATGSITVTPNAQYVVNPSGNDAVDDALLVGISLKVVF